MRRREPALDPAVAAELEALEAALRATPRPSRSSPRSCASARSAPGDGPGVPHPARRARRAAFRTDTFARAARTVALAGPRPRPGHGRGRRPRRDRARRRARPDRRERRELVLWRSGRHRPGRGKESDSAAPRTSPAAPAPRRRVERSTRLELTTTDVQGTADAVVRTTQRTGASSSPRRSQSGGGAARPLFVLRVPAGRLDDAFAALSRLGHVLAAAVRLRHHRQLRLAPRRAWPTRAPSAAACCARSPGRRQRRRSAALRARLADNRRALRRAQSAFDAVRRRASLATIEVDVTGRARARPRRRARGRWTPGDALHDAVRVLEVSAGVAVVALALLVPLGLLAAAGGLAAGALRRRRREAALSA